MTKHLIDDQLINYTVRALTDDQRAEMDRHLATCIDCRSRLAGHEGVQRRIHNKIATRRNAAPPPARLTYAAIATRVHSPKQDFRLGRGLNRFVSGTVAGAALLALVIILIGMFSGARQATVSPQPVVTPTDMPATSRLPKLVWKIEADPSSLKMPGGLALDSHNHLYAVDAGNDRILKYDGDGKFLTQWGSYGTGESQFNFGVTTLDGSNYTQVAVAGGDVATDRQDNIYVVDTLNARIQKFDATGKFLTKWGSAGDSAGQFGHLVGVAVDSQGNVYTAEDDPQSRVQKFDSNGQFLLQWDTRLSDVGSVLRPTDIAIDQQDFIYLLDLVSESIQTFDRGGRFISNWTPRCGGRTVMTGLTKIAFDANSNLYASDRFSKRICKFDRNGQFLVQWDDSTASESFNLVQGIVIDVRGDVYISETKNNRLLKFQQP